jgi:peptide deformylase
MDCSPREEAPPRVCVNPVIVARGEEVLSTEGCLSFPGLTVEVPRAATVTLRARDERGEEFEVALSGLEAICAQHELDHLDGLGFVDRLGPLERRATLLEYLRGLEALRGALEGEGAPTGHLDEAMSLTREALSGGVRDEE